MNRGAPPASAPAGRGAAQHLAAAAANAEAAAGVQSEHHAPLLSSSSSSPISSSRLPVAAQHYVALPRIRALYADAPRRFMDAIGLLDARKVSLDRFRDACRKGKHGLPTSLQLNIAQRAHLPSIEGMPQFFADDAAALRQIEADASAALYKALVSAKEKEIEHLKAAATMDTFVATAVAEFQATVTKDAASRQHELEAAAPAAAPAAPGEALSQNEDASMPDASLPPGQVSQRSKEAAAAAAIVATFPVDAIVEHFRTLLTNEAHGVLAKWNENRRNKAEAEKKARADQLAAEQRIHGDSAAVTIASVADKAAQKAIAPFQRALQQQRQKMDRVSAPKATAGTKRKGAPPAGQFQFHPDFFKPPAQQSNWSGGDRRQQKKTKTKASHHRAADESDEQLVQEMDSMEMDQE